jgi:branched-chain amino acid transport system ATP-binding protein
MLQVEHLSVSYRGVAAVRDVSLAVPAASIVGLVGANGAGKTSTLNAISGLVAHQGEIRMEAADIGRMKTADIVRRGVVQVAQGRQLFPEMSVHDNLELGAFLLPKARVPHLMDQAFEQFPILKARAQQRAGTLSGGEQQQLAVARALMAEPRLLLIDEPCLGLSPKMVARLAEVVRDVHARGIAVLLVEQNTAFVFGLAQHAYVIENGRVVLDGTPDELRRNDKVRSAYLGI